MFSSSFRVFDQSTCTNFVRAFEVSVIRARDVSVVRARDLFGRSMRCACRLSFLPESSSLVLRQSTFGVIGPLAKHCLAAASNISVDVLHTIILIGSGRRVPAIPRVWGTLLSKQKSYLYLDLFESVR